MKLSVLMFLFYFLSLGQALASGSTCKAFLESRKDTLRLPLTEEKLREIKAHILIERIWAFEGLILQDVSDYLSLYNVQHELDKKRQQIVISAHGSTHLNRFARRILKMSEAFQAQGHRILPTILIFNPKELKATKSRGAFTTKYIQPRRDVIAGIDPEFSEKAILTSTIELSIASIIQRSPTATEFHEFIHWKSFVSRLKSKVDTLSFGDVNIKDPSSVYDFESSVRFNFSIEEFQAHLIILNKNLRAYFEETNNDLKEDLLYEIRGDINALALYAAGLKPLIRDYFENSAFKTEDNFIDDPREVLGISASMTELEVVRFDWVEQFALFYPQGAKLGLQALEYQMSNYSNAGWISLVLPLPRGYEGIQDFRDWIKPENKIAFQYISMALYFKMIYLQKLVAYIEDMNTKHQLSGHLPSSPIRYFYELDRQYKDQLRKFYESLD